MIARAGLALGLALGLAALACEAADAGEPEGAPAADDAAASAADDAAASAGEPEGAPAIAPSDEPPGDPAAIGAWLRGGGYRGWIVATPVRPTGDHGGARVLLNPRLAASLRAGAPLHPPGAAAVRELYEPDLATLRGLALMHKTAPGGDDEGRAWFWYEVFGVDDDAARPTVAEAGAPGCVGCHAGGVDLVMPPEAADGAAALTAAPPR